MRTRQALIVSLLVGALALLSSTPCLAAADALTDKAATLYDEGMVSYGKAKWPEARASFLAAWALKNHWQIAGSLGDCEVQLGLYRDAAAHLAYFLRLAPPDRRTAAAKRLYDVARSKVGTIGITVDVPEADVAVDEKVIGKSPLEDPVFVEPGHHKVEARSGVRIANAEVDVIAGAALPVRLSPQSKGPDPVPPPERRSVVPGAVLGGVAGAALVTAIGLTVAASSKRATARGLNQQIALAAGSCVPGAGNLDARCSTLQSTSSTADTLGRTGVGLFAGAGAAALASTLYFVWPASKPRAPASGGVRIAPVVSATGGAVVFSGAF